VANNYDGSSYNINSKLYKWNGASFIEYQSISTQGPYDWEYFTIGTDHYLAVANNYNDSTTNISSKIYRYDRSRYEEAYQAGRQACIDDPTSCGIQNCSAPANVATFDLTSNVLHIPNFENTYWLKFGLTSWEPVQLELQIFGEIGSE